MIVSKTRTDTLHCRSFQRLAIALVTTILLGWAASAAHADQITDQNAVAAMAAAKTPADHQALAAYFTSKAESAEASAENHKQMLATFTGKLQQAMATHCKSVIRSYQLQAKDYAAMAKEEEKLAKGSSKGMSGGMKGM
jgi:hypothetical protein